MTNDTKWEELRQEEELAYFRAGVCLYSPESYTLDENKAICNDMVATSQATLAAMRKDFQGYPPEIQERLLGMLSMSGVESPQRGLCAPLVHGPVVARRERAPRPAPVRGVVAHLGLREGDHALLGRAYRASPPRGISMPSSSSPSAAITGESTAITRATTKARTGGSTRQKPTIRSRLAITTPITPWAIVRSRRRCHSLPVRNPCHATFPLIVLRSLFTSSMSLSSA